MLKDLLATDAHTHSHSHTLTDEGKRTDMLREEELSYRIRSAVFEVSRVLGAEFLEKD